ncbi:PDZ domain-containing protein [Spirosoma soli]|uniref:Tricorn protease homolog n=1 Tax=Spirosoma soli TaxID=1770529 RepID=A0ABW5M2N7_9BACT
MNPLSTLPLAVGLSLSALSALAQLQTSDETLLLRTPTLSADHLAFAYAGDIYLADRNGQNPQRLTVHPEAETDPMFSPDGQWIAFSGNYNGNNDVYVVSVNGGIPRRITFHPNADIVRGWTPDSKRILFASNRQANSARYNQLFTVSLNGGLPELLPMPMAEHGQYSPDGSTIAYTPIKDPFGTWKRYRGGQTTPVWLYDLKTRETLALPHENASDTRPIWVGKTVCFLSDRNRMMNIFAYETGTKQVRQLTNHTDFDVKSLTASGNELVYEQAGRLHKFDLTTGKTQPLRIRIAPDLLALRPQFKSATKFIHGSDISPAGIRAVFEARGEIMTVPLEKGDIRNLTQTPGVHERSPAWSPDGRRVAYFSDASGEYNLVIADQLDGSKKTVIDWNDPSFYYEPRWSPDSKKIVFTDKRLRAYYVDVATQKRTLIDEDTYDNPERSLNPVWSPDSRWIAYTKRLDSQLRAVFLYSLTTGKSTQITDGMSDAVSACFSRNGKHLYFAASTNFGYNSGWLDMTSIERPVKRSLYVIVLKKGDPSPLAPQSDEEKPRDELPADSTQKAVKAIKVAMASKPVSATFAIDLDQIDQRILALPAPERDYSDLQTAADEKLFFLEKAADGSGDILSSFDWKSRKVEEFVKKVTDYAICADGSKLLYAQPGDKWAIVDTKTKPTAEAGKLDLSKMETYVDPKAEWTQIFNEAWRIERDFFYVKNMHGADWPAIRKKYEPFLAHVGHRADLNYLLAEMIGEMVVGHNNIRGGDIATADATPIGLLGADYSIENGRYRFVNIYSGLNWNPDLRAPLTEPGVVVNKGDYLLAVNGKPLTSGDDVYSFFENTADRQTLLTVNSKPTTDGARTVTVVPIKNENALRNRAWVENNRKWVDKQTNGQVAYVYLPNTGEGGYTYFNRYYFSQLDKKAVILDERFNGGGSVADYILDNINRPVMSYWATREGKMFTSPAAAIFGPSVMITNEYAGSGGDALPQFYRRRNLGKIVGKRTWGGLVGIYDYPVLMDGGQITAPRLGVVSPDGKWEVENEGVAPDIEIEMTPKTTEVGADPQLAKATEVVLQALKNATAKPIVSRPADPNRVN